MAVKLIEHRYIQEVKKPLKTRRIDFDDDLVVVYDGDKEIYRGIEDYEPMKNEDWQWDNKLKGYKFDKFTKYCLDESKEIKEADVPVKPKLVIYKDLQGYAVTPEDNYNNRVSNARKIQHLTDFDSAQEVIDYYVKYGWANADDFKVIDESIEVKESSLQELIYYTQGMLDEMGATHEQLDDFCKAAGCGASEVVYSKAWYDAFVEWLDSGKLPVGLKLLGESNNLTETPWVDDAQADIVWDIESLLKGFKFDHKETQSSNKPTFINRDTLEMIQFDDWDRAESFARHYFDEDEDMEELEESIWGEHTQYNKADGWTDEDIELHKSIDWAGRNYEEYPVEDDKITSDVVLYKDGEPEYKTVQFTKHLRSNPIYPPYYAPDEQPFENAVGPMFDGYRVNGYDVHDRYETQEIYDLLSR